MGSRVVPSLAELGRMAASAHYAPIYREVLADVETPVSALLKLGAGPGSFLLESVEGGERVGRYSFLGVNPKGVISVKGGEVTVETVNNPEYNANLEVNIIGFARLLGDVIKGLLGVGFTQDERLSIVEYLKTL